MINRRKAKSDYTEAMLPHDRKQVFLDVCKLYWLQFVLFGVLILLFSLPMHLLALAEDIYSATISQNMEQLTPEEQRSVYLQILGAGNVRGFLNIFSFLILSVGISGLARVVRQYAWEENVVFSVDFFQGIKQNLRQMLLMGLTVGVVNALCVFLYNFSVINSNINPLASVLMLLPIGFSVVVGIPAVAYAVVAASIYNNRIYHNIGIGFAMLARAPLKTYLALICCSVPFVLQMTDNFYLHIIGRILGCFLSPFVMLAWFLFAMDRFDKYINAERFPSLVGRGTYPMD